MKLTKSQKETIIDNLRKGRFASGSLEQKILDDKLEEDSTNTLLSVMEFYLKDVHSEMRYDSLLVKEHEARYAALRQANLRIQELEEQLASKNPIDGFKEQFNLISSTINEWWRADGFAYCPDVRVIHYGTIEVVFGFQLSMRSSMFSKDKEADREDNKRHLAKLKSTGFEFAVTSPYPLYHKDLLDTENNRNLLTTLITNRFPSAEIKGFKSGTVAELELLEEVHVYITEPAEVQEKAI